MCVLNTLSKKVLLEKSKYNMHKAISIMYIYRHTQKLLITHILIFFFKSMCCSSAGLQVVRC